MQYSFISLKKSLNRLYYLVFWHKTNIVHDKYNSRSFTECYECCKLFYCCTHEKESESVPSYSSEPNYEKYWYYYVIWNKLADIIGLEN